MIQIGMHSVAKTTIFTMQAGSQSQHSLSNLISCCVGEEAYNEDYHPPGHTRTQHQSLGWSQWRAMGPNP